MDSNSTSLVKRAEAGALMPPPPPPSKRIKRPAKVLDEDTYTDALSKIIARDFFPGLAETEAQQEYLDSLESKDKSWITSAGRKLAGLMTPGPEGRMKRAKHNTSMTPTSGLVGFAGDTPAGWVGDTPASVASNATSKTSKPEVDTNLSLSSFQSKYTSEDNESFYKLLDKQNQKKRDKYGWLWQGNKVAAPRQIAYREQQAKLEAARQAQEKEDGKPQLAITAYSDDSRRAMPDGWNARPDNNLMFEPSSVEDAVETVQQRAEAASRAGPKQVVYDNTRMPQPEHGADPPMRQPASPTLSAVRDAAAGRPRLSASEVGSEVGGGETPRVNGYAFVDSESSDSESEPEEDWSRLSLGPGDATPNPFVLKEQSSRETLHHSMVDKVARDKRRDKVTAETQTPVPKFVSSPRLTRGGMTPAAQRLLGRVGGKTPGGSIWGDRGATPRMRSGLKDEWTSKVKTPRRKEA